MWDTILVLNVPADALALNGGWSSECTVLTTKLDNIFSSTADIFRCRAFRPSVVSLSTLFSNRKGSLSFYLIFPIFGLNSWAQYWPKIYAIRMLIFSFKFLMDFLLLKIGRNWDFFIVFLAIFSKLFTVGPWNLVHRHIRCTCRCV